MRAIRIHEYGDESVLQLEEVDRPSVSPNELLIDVRAAAVNPFDTYVRAGTVEPDGGLPHVPGGDAAGVVESVGDEVTSFETGDRVFMTGLGLDRPGTYAEYVSVPHHRVARLPDSVDFASGAAAAETVTTGIQALERGGLEPGDVCLVQGATGGVGHATVQVAASEGAFVVGTCRPEVADAARGFGADAVVDYAADDLPAAILEATNGRPVDVVVETHAAANVAADVAVLAERGAIVVLGEDDAIEIEKPVAGAAKAKQLDLRFASHMNARDGHGSKLETAASMLESGDVAVEVAATYALEGVPEAHRRCLSGGRVGKIVLDVDDGR